MKKHLYIGLIIAVLACYYTFRNVSLKELGEAMTSMRYIYLLPALFIFIVYYYFRAVRWKYLILSIKKVEQKRLFSPLMIGFMANLLPARVGELIRAYLLGKREDISFSSSLATIVVERIFDMLSILALFGGLLFFQSDMMDSTGPLGDQDIMGKMVLFGWVSLTISIVLICGLFLLIYRQNLVISWIKFLCRPFSEKSQTKILSFVDSFTKGLYVLKDLKTTSIIILLSACVWGLALIGYYPFFLAFDLDYLPFSSLIILFFVICVFITIFPTPGFVGSFQAACMVVLHNLYGVPEATAASFGIASWAFSMGITVLGGIFFLVKDNISIKEITKAYP